MNFGTNALNILMLVALAIPGFILIKTKLLNATHIAVLVNVLLFVSQPFITFNSFLTQEFSMSLLGNIGIVVGLAFVMQVGMTFFAKLVFLYDKEKARANVYAYAAGFGNCGFMGIPVAQAVMPNNPEAILYIAVFMTVFNILCWTLGVYIITGDKKYISIKKAVLNPAFIAICIALPFFFANVKLPSALMRPVKYLADMNTPLSMLILGMRFACIKLTDIFKGLGVYITAVIKLIVYPLLTFLLLWALPISMKSTLFATIFLIATMPSANMVLIMAEKFDGDKECAAKAVMATTLLSMLTIPIMLLML
ncbi:MAG: AEC family transporter [Clostridia bacterium]